MSIIVVHQPQRVVGIFGRKLKRIVLTEVVGRHGGAAACRSDRAKGGVLVVRGDAACLLEEDELRDILVSVVRVEHVVLPVLLEDERAGRHRLRRVPAKHKVYRVVRRAVQPLDAEITVVHEAVVGVCDAVHRLDVFDAPPHTVELHHDVRRFALPQDRAVLAVVGDLPIAGRGLYKRLVPVVVELRQESSGAFRDVRVLVEAVGNICTISAEVERFDAVADVVVLVGVLRQVRGRRVLSP